MVSSNTEGRTSFVGPGSMDVKFEGKNVQLLGDPMLNNCGPSGSPANAATMVGVIQLTGIAALFGDEICPVCKKAHKDEGKLEETPDTQADSDTLNATAKRAVAKAEQSRADAIEKKRGDMQDAVNRDFQQRKQRIEAGLAAARNEKGMDFNREQLARLGTAPPTVTTDEAERALGLPHASMTTMLGFVRGKNGQTYAGKSVEQLVDLYNEIPKNWHSPRATESMLRTQAGAQGISLGDLQRQSNAKSEIERQWQQTTRANQRWRARGCTGTPYYPPGQCAAQQLVVLALDHGTRPVGLTERWYKSTDPEDAALRAMEATVTVEYRSSPSAQPELGSFGGKQSVPPCKTCEIMLTMLMCPDSKKPEEKKIVAGCRGC